MNRLTSVLTLPSWANNPEGKALCEAIIDEQPDFFVRSGTWIEGGGVRRYKGKNAGKLRRLWSDQLEDLTRVEAALWRAGGNWQLVNQRANDLLASERPDALIERLVEGFTVMSPKQLSDPLKGVEP